ncbi:uridine diphosphate glucose pyrophosphatase-like isoform X1 [Varroa jacobsoni]|uniref:uridine diphosphate glucose pyrophosphatase-like isoform X1 n=1 Tax=Varroa jacobsoni TaxID=62625 RepID=UPI000BF2F325|nr:uridine diphosphate glucose pyrophosphatase-like isoform X1 [Varroa jacobsoni]XP_022706632.1 uridine diphosphate glucose pyrophosphatase-like isoform X1 [Varroa jacobsoni]XP_022706633.1 uridine diphosphate glucose pyrophosphatase-like isoform X1 [Varroa jacobsoni]
MLKNRVWLLQKQIMDKICDVRIVDCLESSYIKPYRMEYKQNGRQRVWDLCKVHDSVACIVYNSTRDRLLFVTQFRPGVYMNRCSSVNGVVDTDRYPGSLGLTLELCAGITDKDKTVEQTMQEELEEEIGYHVPLDRIQKVTAYRSGVGTQGSKQTLFYAVVRDEDRTSSGGGNDSEGEMIQVIEMSPSEAQSVLMDESIMRPPSLLFAVQWWLANHASKFAAKEAANK